MKTLEERLREKVLPSGARVLSGDTILVKDALAILVADAPRIYRGEEIKDAPETIGAWGVEVSGRIIWGGIAYPGSFVSERGTRGTKDYVWMSLPTNSPSEGK